MDINMKLFRGLHTETTNLFATTLALELLADLQGVEDKTQKKYQIKVQKTLARCSGRVLAFKQLNTPNYYQRARMAHTFLWALKDGGCPDDYADELTQWLTVRL